MGSCTGNTNNCEENCNQCSCPQKADGQCGGCGSNAKTLNMQELTKSETDFIAELLSHCYLPVTQFILEDKSQSDFSLEIYSPVYIANSEQIISATTEIGKMLENLEQRGILSLDYDIPLSNYDYDDYYKSLAYTSFEASANTEIAQTDSSDIYPTIRKGSMTLTQQYLTAIDGEHKSETRQ